MDYGLMLGLCFGGLLAGGLVARALPYLMRQGPWTWRPVCRACGGQFAVVAAVPIAGYLFAAGRRCRCGERRPLGDLILSLAGAGLFALAAPMTAPRIYLFLFLATVLLAATVADLRARIIPNRLVIPGILLALPATLLLGAPLLDPAMGLLTGGGILFILAVLKPGGMGMGDVKLAALLGSVLGVDVLTVLWISSLGLAVTALILLALRRLSRKDLVPFGPFLSGAGALVFLLGG